jgi:hypothetical protein
VEGIEPLKFGFGIATHHDSITGTSFHNVIEEYLETINIFVKESSEPCRPLITQLMGMAVEHNFTSWFEATFENSTEHLVAVTSQETAGTKFVKVRYNSSFKDRVSVGRVGEAGAVVEIGPDSFVQYCEGKKAFCELSFYQHMDRFETRVFSVRLRDSDSRLPDSFEPVTQQPLHLSLDKSHVTLTYTD